MIAFSPNDQIRVRLTEHGKQLVVQWVDKFNDHIRANRPGSTFRVSVPRWDSDGWITGQFWDIMGYFDGSWSAGSVLPFSELEKA